MTAGPIYWLCDHWLTGYWPIVGAAVAAVIGWDWLDDRLRH